MVLLLQLLLALLAQVKIVVGAAHVEMSWIWVFEQVWLETKVQRIDCSNLCPKTSCLIVLSLGINWRSSVRLLLGAVQRRGSWPPTFGPMLVADPMV